MHVTFLFLTFWPEYTFVIISSNWENKLEESWSFTNNSSISNASKLNEDKWIVLRKSPDYWFIELFFQSELFLICNHVKRDFIQIQVKEWNGGTFCPQQQLINEHGYINLTVNRAIVFVLSIYDVVDIHFGLMMHCLHIRGCSLPFAQQTLG